MQKIVDDFFKSARLKVGVGLYKGDTLFGELKEFGGISKNAVRKWEHYGHVPEGFFLYLKKIEITTEVEKVLTEELMLELLWRCMTKNKMSDEDWVWAESTRKRLHLRLYPELKKAMAGQERNWAYLETYRRPARRKTAA